MKTIALSLVILAGVAGGCSNKTTAESAVAGEGTAPATQPAGALAPAGSARSFSGTVLETMDAASYTYVRVKTEAGDLWAASGQFPVKVGDRVTVPIETPMENFRSESLNRDFPIIYFASRITREGEGPRAAMPPLASSHEPSAPAGMGGAMGSMMGMGGQAPKATPIVEKMAPPEGGMSVAEVWEKRASLAGKTVTVRGTVVKFNGGIMGRNWVHIQDGSGKAEAGTHDLTVTCDVAVKPGDVMTATGVVGVDKDFTAGYVYPVIIENAKVVVK